MLSDRASFGFSIDSIDPCKVSDLPYCFGVYQTGCCGGGRWSVECIASVALCSTLFGFGGFLDW